MIVKKELTGAICAEGTENSFPTATHINVKKHDPKGESLIGDLLDVEGNVLYKDAAFSLAEDAVIALPFEWGEEDYVNLEFAPEPVESE